MTWFLAADAPPGGGMMPALITLLPWLFFIIVFYYFFVAAPMKKKQKAFQTMMAGLKSGDRVVTTGGMYGIVTNMTDKTIKLRIANNVVVDMDKSAIAGLATEETKEDKK